MTHDGYVVCRAKKLPTGEYMPDLALSSKLNTLEEAKKKLAWLTKGVQHKKPIRIFVYRLVVET